MTSKAELFRHAVNPSRLDYGLEAGRKEGDVRASYSADKIIDGKIRRPFTWQGRSFVTVGSCGKDAEAYSLVPVKAFTGTATTYRDKTGTMEAAEAARNDPNGFYHGMAVKSGGETFVLCGPPVIFTASPDEPEAAEPSQMTLF